MEALTFLLLLLCVGLAGSSAVDLQKRIYGGKDCRSDERLYHVQVISQDDQEKYSLCGGSLISNQWVLTAAHCENLTMWAILGVHGGTKDVQEITEKPLIYKDFDIMFLKLPKATTIKPVSVATKNDCNTKPVKDQPVKVNVAGHGNYLADQSNLQVSEPSDKLLCVDMDVVKCTSSKTHTCAGVDYNHIICAGNGKDVGKGDSGGGVIYDGKLYGVVSSGTKRVCDRSDSSRFVDICSFHKKYSIPS